MARRQQSSQQRRRRARRGLRLLGSLRKLLPSKSVRKRWWKKYRRASAPAQIALCVAAVLIAWFVLNGLYQVARKPTELFFPVSGTLYKTPVETWEAYSTIFRRHATTVITPDLLAALAQIEGSGNPVARTYWRWSLSRRPLEIYRPASSAVGMFQITDGTFSEARKLCIHDHRVVEDGPWHAWRSCWLNALYFRVVPSHAVELTSAYLDRQVNDIVARYGKVSVSLNQKQTLAALVHLCGAGAGTGYARRGYKLLPRQRCGDHAAAGYIARVSAMRAVFQRLAAAETD
jgi:hypothetical protein